MFIEKRDQKLKRINKHIRTSIDLQLKESSLTKQKTRPRTDYNLIEKKNNKKSDQKNRRSMSKFRI